MAKKKASTPSLGGSSFAGATNRLCKLGELHPDRQNPRFASSLGANPTEQQIIDCIVEVHQVDDVLSSIGVNGFFAHEPLLGLQETPQAPIVIVEGNRRLAACLILGGDERAHNHLNLREQFRGMAGFNIEEVPVTILRKRDTLLIAYLGIRHIAGAKAWDGYAKAAWVASVLDGNSEITLAQITQMTGDQHRTIARLLEGYYFITQLQRSNRFSPEESLRSGRRSSAKFPFSWVYTILGFSGIREWLGITGDGTNPSQQPIPERSLDRAEKLTDLMFGNRSRKISPVISDSRQLQDLAKVVSKPKVMEELSRGVPITAAVFQIKQTDEQLIHYLTEAQRGLEGAQTVLGGNTLSRRDARSIEQLAGELRTRAIKIHKTIVDVMTAVDEGAENT